MQKQKENSLIEYIQKIRSIYFFAVYLKKYILPHYQMYVCAIRNMTKKEEEVNETRTN